MPEHLITVQAKPTPLWKIFAALLYDWLLILSCIMVLGFIIVAVDAALHGLPKAERGIVAPVSKTGILHYLLVLNWFLVPWLFFAYFWSKQSQTLGMRAWRLIVVNQQGKSPTFAQATKRFLYATITLLPLGIGLWWRYSNPERLSLYDRLSQTQIYSLSKNPYPKRKP